MKFLIAFGLMGFVAISLGAPKPSTKETLGPLIMQCHAQEGGSESDLASLNNAQFPESPAGHCIITCIHEKAGIVSHS